MQPNGNQSKAPDRKPGAKPEAKGDLKSLPLPEVEKKLGSSPDGLSQAEAQKRLTQYGPNEIQEKKTNPFLKFLSYFWGPIPWMIEVAVILSGVVRTGRISSSSCFCWWRTRVVGFWEERQAGDAIAALKAKLALKAKVKRDGKWTDPAARDVVPGDVIRLRLGDIVPADARLLAPGRNRSGGVPNIAARAYEIYEERGRHDGQADQDWLQAERETQKDKVEHGKAV